MHRSRNRLIQQGGFLTACAMGRNGFARVHGGESHSEHLSTNPSGQHQKNKACCDQVGEHRLALEADPVHGPHGRDDGNPADGLVDEGKYGHGSLLCGFTLGRLALDKLRPDSRPVVGAEVLTRYRAFGGLLDLHAAFNWDGPIALSPLADSRLPNAKGFRQMSLATKGLNGFVDCVHEHQYRHCRCSTQVHCL